jgi:hypothetical protein
MVPGVSAVGQTGFRLACWGIMRLSSIAARSAAVALLIGSAAGLARADADSVVRLNWSASNFTSGAAEPTTAANANDDGLVPDFEARFQGYDLQLTPSFDDALLAGAPPYSPSAALASDGAFLSTTIALASDLHLRLVGAQTRPIEPELPQLSDMDQLQLSRSAELGGSRSLLAGADWDVASWGGLGIAGSQVESDSYFGAPVGFEFPSTKVTTMLGVSAHLNFGDGWVTSFTYDEGRTQLDLRPDALAVADDEKGFDVAVSKSGVFGQDIFGLALIRPVQPNANNLTTSGSFSGLLGPQISLSSATPETDLQLDYETSFNGNITLQADAGYQMNVAGQSGAKAVSVLSRAKINF